MRFARPIFSASAGTISPSRMSSIAVSASSDSLNPSGSDITVVAGTEPSQTYTGEAAKVQLLKMNDPEFEPTSAYGNVDAIARYGIKNMVNQIDYSS